MYRYVRCCTRNVHASEAMISGRNRFLGTDIIHTISAARTRDGWMSRSGAVKVSLLGRGNPKERKIG